MHCPVELWWEFILAFGASSLVKANLSAYGGSSLVEAVLPASVECSLVEATLLAPGGSSSAQCLLKISRQIQIIRQRGG